MNQEMHRIGKNDGNESGVDKVAAMAKEGAANLREKSEELKESTKSVANQVSHQAKSTVTEQKDQAVNQLHGVAEALRQTSEHLRRDNKTTVATYSNQVADQIDRMSGYLQDRNLNELMHDAEDFARRQPELFIGGAFTLGLLAARFMKSSSAGTQIQSAKNYRAGYQTEGSSLRTAGPYSTPQSGSYRMSEER